VYVRCGPGTLDPTLFEAKTICTHIVRVDLISRDLLGTAVKEANLAIRLLDLRYYLTFETSTHLLSHRYLRLNCHCLRLNCRCPDHQSL
jgi:hypothetical protein